MSPNKRSASEESISHSQTVPREKEADLIAALSEGDAVLNNFEVPTQVNCGRPQDDAFPLIALRVYLEQSDLDSQWSGLISQGSKNPTKKKKLPVKPEVLLTIAFYHPRYPSEKAGEYQLLGLNTLADLRDAFRCLRDVVIFDERQYSGAFFIEEVLYVDDRSSEDAVTNTLGITHNYLVKSNMTSTSLIDLKIRKRCPYVYAHAENCSHIFMINDVQLVSLSPTEAQIYPKKISESTWIAPKCSLCEKTEAVWLTYDDTQAPRNPCSWCSRCFDLFHNDKSGNLLYTEFKLFSLARNDPCGDTQYSQPPLL